MPVYYQQDWSHTFDPPDPTAEPLGGLKQLRRPPADAAMRAQDLVAAQSRRVVMSYGLHGSERWRVPDTTPDTVGGSRTHPSPVGADLISVAQVQLTPGCMLRAVAFHLPSGETQNPDGSDWEGAGAQGSLRIDCTWHLRDATSSTTQTTLQLAASALQYGAAPSGAGAQWGGLRAHQVDLRPAIDWLAPAEVVEVNEHITVDISVYTIGSPRIVDFVIEEVPYQWAREADDDDSYWVGHTLGVGHPSFPAPEPRYPVTRINDTSPDGDPRGGSLQILRVLKAQRLRLGPQLFHWYHSSEDISTPTNTFSYEQISGDTSGYVNALSEDQTSYDETEPGWAMGTAGYARDWLHNGPGVHFQTPRDAAVPVLVAVSGVATNTACPMRLMTSDYSWIDLTLTTTAGWHYGWGWLEVPVNPEYATPAQIFVDVPSGATMNLSAVTACVLRTAPAAVP